MEFKTYRTLSQNVRQQIDRVKKLWHAHLGNDLTGLYLHGSLALGRFVEETSDLDFLAVCEKRISPEQRLLLAKGMAALQQSPCPLEMSAIWKSHLIPWNHPTLCQFHYSGLWDAHYRGLLQGTILESKLIYQDFQDPDIACHVNLTRQYGICLYGQPTADLLPAVPEHDFWHSLCEGLDTSHFPCSAREQANYILTLVRVYSYQQLRKILSKYDAAIWAKEHLPRQYGPLLDDAVQVCYNQKSFAALQGQCAQELCKQILKKLQA